MATIIPFPDRPSASTRPRGVSWQGALVDLAAARAMVPGDEGEESDQSDEDATGTSARTIAIRTLATKGRSVQEMRQRLIERGVDQESIDGEITRLIDEGLLDDLALARGLADAAHRTKKLGPQAIRQALMARAIPRSIIDDVIGGLSVNSDALTQLAEARLRQLGGLSADVAKRRLLGFLARRGYTGSEVYALVDALVGRGGGHSHAVHP